MFNVTAKSPVRPPTVAGSFYPAEPAELARVLRESLAAGRDPATPASGAPPVALIVPHAGYVYSGATAGRAFAALASARVDRIILLGPSHRVGFGGGALPAEGITAFATPLGDVPLDTAAIARLRPGDQFAGPAHAHDREHSIEVQLPFIQKTLGAVPIVPIIVGAATDERLARAMAHRLADLAGVGTVVVVSSDFTHHGRGYGYAPFPADRVLPDRLIAIATAQAGRAATVDFRGFRAAIATADDTVCGVRPIDVLLELLAHACDAEGRITGVTTSAEVSGATDQVVTYAGIAFTGTWRAWRDDPPPPPLAALSGDEQRAVAALARATIETHLGHGAQLARWFAQFTPSGNLLARAGVFVTVNNCGAKAVAEGRLRGCIGVIEAREPLVDAVISGAVSAAHDPRFRPLGADELGAVAVEVSVLSPLRRVAGFEEIVIGSHGVLLHKDGRSAVFLPQVGTETGWDRDTFLTQLARKAGLAGDAWRHGASFEVFTAQVIHEAA